MNNIAFLGTGIMGRPMAKNLCLAGFNVTVWNRSREKAIDLSEFGAQVAGHPADAVQHADCVIVMLSSGPVVDQILFEPDAKGRCVAEEMQEDSICVVMSSIPLETVQAQARKLGRRGIRYIDAPVSGGEKGAVEAGLTIMAGGRRSDLDAVSNVLAALGRLTRVGSVGSGQLAKLANQVIVGITIGAVAEAFVLAEAGGAELKAVREALLGGFADSTILRQHGERMIRGDFEAGAQASVQLKDLNTADELAKTHGLELPVLRLLRDMYAKMCADGRAELDHSALYLELSEQR